MIAKIFEDMIYQGKNYFLFKKLLKKIIPKKFISLSLPKFYKDFIVLSISHKSFKEISKLSKLGN
jgi:hypothetical protein